MKVIIALTILATALQTGSCIKCYLCESKTQDACHDLTTGELQPRECTPDLLRTASTELTKNLRNLGNLFNVDLFATTTLNVPMACQKTVTTINGEKLTVRGCQLGRSDSLDPCKIFENKVGEQTNAQVDHCSLCEEDGCNGAGSLRGLVLHCALLPAILLFVWRVLGDA